MPSGPTDTEDLPDTPALLVSGGDARIRRDPLTGLSAYGCGARPDPDLIALGSCTASTVSTAGQAAADALRAACVGALADRPAAEVYATHARRLRSALLDLCGLRADDGVASVLAASGTDVLLLVAQWLKPDCAVMVEPGETGSGAMAALGGRHFNCRTAYRASVTVGDPIGDWQGDLLTLPVRRADGSLRDAAEVDAEWTAGVDALARAGRRVLLILTDVTKTGLIVPGIETVLALKQRWPGQVEVLVDACQFRISTGTVRAYAAQDCMVALTGSKFLSGPTFSGLLLVPPATAARYRDLALGAGAGAYSGMADWPDGWGASRSLPATTNFGLLLRWEAAMAEWRALLAVPAPVADRFVDRFAVAITGWLASHRGFEPLPVAPLDRTGLQASTGWEDRQTIFPFLLRRTDGHTGERYLRREETQRLYMQLREPAADGDAPRIQLGQPVPCGERGGVPVSALRLCVSARMVVAAANDAGSDRSVRTALAALDRIGLLAGTRVPPMHSYPDAPAAAAKPPGPVSK